MDWKQMLADLKQRGWTQQAVAERVGASQASISDLARGVTKDPAHSIGLALSVLHAEVVRPSPVDRGDVADAIPFAPGSYPANFRTHADGLQAERNDRTEVVIEPKP